MVVTTASQRQLLAASSEDGHMVSEKAFALAELTGAPLAQTSYNNARSNVAPLNTVKPSDQVSTTRNTVEVARGFLTATSKATRAAKEKQNEMTFAEARDAALRAVTPPENAAKVELDVPAAPVVHVATSACPVQTKTPIWVYVVLAIGVLALMASFVPRPVRAQNYAAIATKVR